MRRLLLVALAAAVGATTAPLVPLSAAHAATTTEVTYFTTPDGLYKRAGSSVTLVEPGSVDSLSASGDGSRVVYRRFVGGFEYLVARDASGRQVRALGGFGHNGTDFPDSVNTPALSPDGTVMAYDHDAVGSWLIDSHDLATDRGGYVFGTQDRGHLLGFADDTHLLFATPHALVSIPVAGGTRTMVVGSAGIKPIWPSTGGALAPDGSKIAFTVQGADAANPTNVVVAALTHVGETWTIGPLTTLATGGDNRSPTWSRDGQTITYVHRDTPAGSGDLLTVPATGGTAVPLSTPEDETSVAVVAVDDTGPGATSSAPATLQGTVAEARWQLPPDPDVSGVVLTRKLGTTVQRKVTVFAPRAAFVDSGLVVGQTYTYTAQPFDRSGNFGPGSVRTVTAMAVAPSAPDPITNTQTHHFGFPVRFASAAPEAARFTVDYRVVPDPVWRHWVADQPGTVRTFGLSAPEAGVEPTQTAFGKTYQFQVTGTDGHGNATPTVTTERIVVPHDNSGAVFSKGTGAGLRADRYHGDVQTLFTAGHTATITLTGDRFQVIGERLPTGGRFVVYAKKGTGSWVRLSPTMDTYAATRQPRKVLYTHWFTTTQTLTYQVRWVPGPSATRKVVALDAFAARR